LLFITRFVFPLPCEIRWPRAERGILPAWRRPNYAAAENESAGYPGQIPVRRDSLRRFIREPSAVDYASIRYRDARRETVSPSIDRNKERD